MSKNFSIDPKTNRFVSEYDEEVKDKVVSLYLIVGTLTKTAALANIPYRTVYQWSTTDWFKIKLEEAKKKYSRQLDSRFTGLLQHISKQLEDRILKGDVTITQAGKQVRHPIKAAELARIGDSIFKSLQLIRGEATSNVRTLEPEEKLDKIREKLLSAKDNKQESKSNDILH